MRTRIITMYQHVKDRASLNDRIAIAKVDADFPIGTYSSNRFSIGDRKTFKTPLYKGKIKFRKKMSDCTNRYNRTL